MENPGGCPYQSAFDLLSKRHAITIIWCLQQKEPRRFTELRDFLTVNPATLSQRLGDLEAHQILVRREFSELPPRVEYSLTDKGRDLVHLIEKMCEWACKWDEQCPDAPPMAASSKQ